MSSQTDKFNESLFWDTDMNPEDYHLYPRQVIERVMSRGNLEDWNLLKSIFGIEKIKETIKDLRYMHPKLLQANATLFNIPIQEFRAYKTIRKAWWE